MYWRALDPLKRSIALSDVAPVLVLAWMLGVMGLYDGGPAIHLLLIVAVVVLIAPFRPKRRPHLIAEHRKR
jgi:uncharacterized protein DUF5670